MPTFKAVSDQHTEITMENGCTYFMEDDGVNVRIFSFDGGPLLLTLHEELSDLELSHLALILTSVRKWASQ